jgi:hypothetical protein
MQVRRSHVCQTLQRAASQPFQRLQLSQDGVGARDLDSVSNNYIHLPKRCETYRDLTRALLVLGIDDLAVVKDHSPATVTVAHTRRPAVLLGEESLCVAEEKDLVVLDAVDLAPGVHDPAVVARNGSNDIDTLFLELLGLCNVGW